MTLGYVDSLVRKILINEHKYMRSEIPFALHIKSIVNAVFQIHSDELFSEKYLLKHISFYQTIIILAT